MVKRRFGYQHLKSYFTNMEGLLSSFKDYVAASSLQKRIIVVHGVGGVGKSSLLQMFQFHCEDGSVPVAIAQGNEVTSVIDILSAWAAALREHGIQLNSFYRSRKHYLAVQAKVEEQAQKAQEIRHQALGEAGKALTKSGIDTVASAIPMLGPAAGVLSSVGADTIVNWMRGFLSKPDVDLILHPAKKLTEQFLKEIQSAGDSRRIVLMLDALDHLTAHDSWVRNLLEELHPNVLFVLAGRAMPKWSHQWPDFIRQAASFRVEPMAEADMRTLVHRYYSYVQKGLPRQEQVEQIIRFSRGLPIVVNSAVQLWAMYGVEDFESIKPEVVADLAVSLRKGVPREMYPVLEAAAAVRWFNKDILEEITGRKSIDDDFEELRTFPSIYPRSEGFAVHDEVRAFLEENLRLESPEKYKLLHERAARYFEHLAGRPEPSSGKDAERQSLTREKYFIEAIYHTWLLDAEEGFSFLSREINKAFTLSHLAYCELLIAEASRHELEDKSAGWLTYWKGELTYRHGLWFEALNILKGLVETHSSEDQAVMVPSYLTMGKILYQQGDLNNSRDMFEEGLRIIGNLRAGGEVRQAIFTEYLAKVYRMEGDFDVALKFHIEALNLSEQLNDPYQICSNLGGYGTTLILAGHLTGGVEYLSKSIDLAQSLGFNLFVSTGLRSRAAGLLLLGKLKSAETDATRSHGIAERLGDIYNSAFANLILGRVYLERQEFDAAGVTLNKAIRGFERVGAKFDLGNALLSLSVYYQTSGDYVQALEALDRAEAVLAPLTFKYGLGWLHLRKGGIYDATGRPELGRLEYNQSFRMAESMESLYLKSKALVEWGRLELKQGEREPGEKLLAEAEKIAGAAGYFDQAALVSLYQGVLSLREGDLETAFQLFTNALTQAVQYNCFLFDSVMNEIRGICHAANAGGRSAIEQRLLDLAQNLEGLQLQGGTLVQQEMQNRLWETNKHHSNIRALLT